MLRIVRAGSLAGALALAAARAAFGREGRRRKPRRVDPSYVAAGNAVAERRYADALRLLGEALGRDPQDADTHNLLGYVYRKTGNLERAFHHYHEALRLNPGHRGAHEYIGEAYLLAGNVAKAEDHLRQLDHLCQVPCEERDDLRKAIADYTGRRRTSGPTR